jgi:hypothetical protein
MTPNEWTSKADNRLEMAVSETIKQLEHEANALWVGKRVLGNALITGSLIDALVSRVALSYRYSDDKVGLSVDIAFYVVGGGRYGTVERYVQNPMFIR